jgi:hypothetical protein
MTPDMFMCSSVPNEPREHHETRPSAIIEKAQQSYTSLDSYNQKAPISFRAETVREVENVLQDDKKENTLFTKEEELLSIRNKLQTFRNMKSELR